MSNPATDEQIAHWVRVTGNQLFAKRVAARIEAEKVRADELLELWRSFGNNGAAVALELVANKRRIVELKVMHDERAEQFKKQRDAEIERVKLLDNELQAETKRADEAEEKAAAWNDGRKWRDERIAELKRLANDRLEAMKRKDKRIAALEQRLEAHHTELGPQFDCGVCGYERGSDG